MTETTEVAKQEPAQLTNYQDDWWNPRTFEAATQMAERMSKAQLVPNQYRGKPDDILVAWSLGSPLGLSLLSSLQHIAVINGRPSIWGDAAMAICRAHPACKSIHEEIQGDGNDLVAICSVVRAGESEPIVRQFSVDDAKRAKLWGDTKRSPWIQYPKRMLQMRARSWALRDAFPDALCGMPIAEELRDITDDVVVRDVPREPEGATATERLKNRLRPAQDQPVETEPEPNRDPDEDTIEHREDLVFRYETAVNARAGGDPEKAAVIIQEIEESVGEPVGDMPIGALEKLVVKMEERLAKEAKKR